MTVRYNNLTVGPYKNIVFISHKFKLIHVVWRHSSLIMEIAHYFKANFPFHFSVIVLCLLYTQANELSFSVLGPRKTASEGKKIQETRTD